MAKVGKEKKTEQKKNNPTTTTPEAQKSRYRKGFELKGQLNYVEFDYWLIISTIYGS